MGETHASRPSSEAEQPSGAGRGRGRGGRFAAAAWLSRGTRRPGTQAWGAPSVGIYWVKYRLFEISSSNFKMSKLWRGRHRTSLYQITGRCSDGHSSDRPVGHEQMQLLYSLHRCSDQKDEPRRRGRHRVGAGREAHGK